MTVPTPGRPHSLAPAHLGEAHAGATLAIAVLGAALFIAAIGVVIGGLTMAASFDSADLPPNLSQLGTWQVIGGFALFAVSVLMVGGALAVLAGSTRLRLPVGGLATGVAVAAIGGGLFLMLRGPSDLILALTLFGLALGLGAAGLILIRPRR